MLFLLSFEATQFGSRYEIYTVVLNQDLAEMSLPAAVRQAV